MSLPCHGGWRRDDAARSAPPETGITRLRSRLHEAEREGADNPLVADSGKMLERIGSSAGLTIYDPRTGKERGGMATFADGRANVCLDYGEGVKEAACLSVAPDDNYAAVILNGLPGEPQYDRVTMFVGKDGSGSIKAFGGGANKGGVMIRAGRGPAKVQVWDTTGTLVGDALTPR